MQEETYLKSDVVFYSGDPPDALYCIRYGSVAIFDEDGLEIMHLKDGDVFGEVTLILKKRRYITVVTLESTLMYKLSAEDLEKCFSRYPNLHQSIVDRAQAKFDKLFCSSYEEKQKVSTGGRQRYSVLHLM